MEQLRAEESDRSCDRMVHKENFFKDVDTYQVLCGTVRNLPAGTVHAGSAYTDRLRRRHRYPLLRRLSLRPAPGEERVAQLCLPGCAWPRDRRACEQGRQCCDEVQARRSCGCRLPGRLMQNVPELCA